MERGKGMLLPLPESDKRKEMLMQKLLEALLEKVQDVDQAINESCEKG